MKSLFFLGSIFIFLLSVPAQSKTESISILCLGDSLTAGYGLEREQAYPALLQEHLEKKGNFNVINAGVSGNTSAGGLRRIDWYFKQKIDIIILALGANDGLRGIDPTSTKKNLQMIIDKARARNSKVKIILAGMKVPPSMGKEFFDAFEKIFPELAEENKCALIPFLLEGVGGVAAMNLPDGIHPNAEGQKLLFKNVLKVLEKLLPQN